MQNGSNDIVSLRVNIKILEVQREVKCSNTLAFFQPVIVFDSCMQERSATADCYALDLDKSSTAWGHDVPIQQWVFWCLLSSKMFFILQRLYLVKLFWEVLDELCLLFFLLFELPLSSSLPQKMIVEELCWVCYRGEHQAIYTAQPPPVLLPLCWYDYTCYYISENLKSGSNSCCHKVVHQLPVFCFSSIFEAPNDFRFIWEFL